MDLKEIENIEVKTQVNIKKPKTHYHFQDVTDKICSSIIKQYGNNIKSKYHDPQYKDLLYCVNYDNKGNIHVLANWKVEQKGKKDNALESEDKLEEKNRNYRVFRINIRESGKEEKYYILNTNYSGKNSHPGKHFWEFDEYLIDRIKNF